jgi:hypothetical protein
MSARRAVDLQAVADRLPDALAVSADIRQRADCEAVVAAALDRYRHIDVLVNNAGIAHGGNIPSRATGRRHMLERGSGSIINIASAGAFVSLDRYGLAGYAASKSAVVGPTRELAAQWGGRGVRVNTIAPGCFPTASSGLLVDPDQVAWISARAALGRPGRLDDLDGQALFHIQRRLQLPDRSTVASRRRLAHPITLPPQCATERDKMVSTVRSLSRRTPGR